MCRQRITWNDLNIDYIAQRRYRKEETFPKGIFNILGISCLNVLSILKTNIHVFTKLSMQHIDYSFTTWWLTKKSATWRPIFATESMYFEGGGGGWETVKVGDSFHDVNFKMSCTMQMFSRIMDIVFKAFIFFNPQDHQLFVSVGCQWVI